jgi:hypothetical protein
MPVRFEGDKVVFTFTIPEGRQEDKVAIAILAEKLMCDAVQNVTTLRVSGDRKYRMYFWLFGAAGGEGVSPWQYKDFSSEKDMISCFKEMEELLNKYVLIAGDALPQHADGEEVVPPIRSRRSHTQ